MSGGRPSLAIAAFVAHARNVPSEARERFAAAALELAADPRVIVVRTCHRVEVYVATENVTAGHGWLSQALLNELPAGGRELRDQQAAAHLFAVAAGLDSVVLGEDQVLHQLRDTLSARHLGALEDSGDACAEGNRAGLPAAQPTELVPVLDRLFQLALHVGRQTRAWREGQPRSLADVALDRIRANLSLAGRSVLIVGAGQMGRIAALAAARREAHVVVANRTPDRAARLAADVGGTTAPFGDVPAGVAGVICAIGGNWPLSEAARAALTDPYSDTTVVDLSSPPALDDAIRVRLGQRFVSVDDIARGPADSVRPKLLKRMERLINEAVAELSAWCLRRSAVPTIQALTELAEARRAAEVERLLRRIPDLPEHERELVEQMSHRLVAGLLHQPLASLRDDRDGERDNAARQLFAL